MSYDAPYAMSSYALTALTTYTILIQLKHLHKINPEKKPLNALKTQISSKKAYDCLEYNKYEK